MSLKKLLGFQVRSPGGPGPLTLKEVEELEHLTQQLMQDMEHPQRQNVAVSGEPATGRDAWPRHRAGWCLWLLPPIPPPRPSQLVPYKCAPFLLLISIFSGLPRVLRPVSPAPGACAARGSRPGAAVPHHLLHLPPV